MVFALECSSRKVYVYVLIVSSLSPPKKRELKLLSVQAAAFLLGGVFVLMQYMSSRSLININWNALTSSYDSLITSRAGPPASQGGNRAKNLVGWFFDFVSADVQSRATFVAGVLLGLRIG